RRPTPRWSAALIFVLTGAWFAAVKTLPWANALTVNVLARITPNPQIVLDPTDLIALAALWPAWRLWRRLESAPDGPSRRQAAVALALASLATIATSCPYPPPGVVNLVTSGTDIYAHFSYFHAEAYSADGGRTWAKIELATLPLEIAEQITQTMTLPVTACDPQAPDLCYRVSGDEIVEGSKDGGQTWKVVWRIPWGRDKYFKRLPQAGVVCPLLAPDFGPYDLVFVPQGERSVLVVAMGDQGVLVRTPDGDWQQHSVLDAAPTPRFSGMELEPIGIILMILPEEIFILSAAALTWTGIAIWAWRILLAAVPTSSKRSIWGTFIPLLVGVLAIVGLIGIPIVSLRFEAFFSPLPIISLGVWIGAVTLTWHRIQSISSIESTASNVMKRVSWLTPAGMMLAWLPFLLWIWGVVPFYEIALGLAIAIGVGSLAQGIRTLKRTLLSVATDMPSRVILTKPLFLLVWVLATMIGQGIGVAVREFPSHWLSELFRNRMGWFFIRDLSAAIVVALTVSAMQWFVIGSRHRALRWWIPLSVIGAGLGIWMREYIFPVIPNSATGMITIALYGAVVGLAQWLALRRWCKHAGWWILASALSQALMILVTQWLWDKVRIEFVAQGVGGAAGALITGLAFLWLARQPQEVEEE
ncbi:MAG: hypothetical protein JXA21_29835, partial [Anaerolineae bacterium]|nr:hypothetical protein [Anaerolineae bacterium]